MMDYELVDASKKDIGSLIEFKLESVLFTDDEAKKKKITDFVKKSVPLDLRYYKLIFRKDCKIGVISLKPFEDGILIDELYIDFAHRDEGLGSIVVKDLKEQYNSIYCYARNENKRAIAFIQKNGFFPIKTDENRILFIYKKNKENQKI